MLGTSDVATIALRQLHSHGYPLLRLYTYILVLQVKVRVSFLRMRYFGKHYDSPTRGKLFIEYIGQFNPYSLIPSLAKPHVWPFGIFYCVPAQVSHIRAKQDLKVYRIILIAVAPRHMYLNTCILP
jgi:hypothetical protein